MKFFYRQLFVAFLLLGFAFNAKAVNDTLTVGEVFNWQVGDTFIYKSTTWIPTTPPTTYTYPLSGFTVIEKLNSGDSIVYQFRNIPNGDTGIFNTHALNLPITSFINTSTILWDKGVCNCDSFTYYCLDTIYMDTTGLNYHIYYSKYSGNSYVNYCYSEMGENIGVKWNYVYISFQDIPPRGYDTRLVYYSSGATVWMDSARYLYNSIPNQVVAPTFHLSPNPTTDALTITADNQTPVTVSVYSATGVLMGSYQKPDAGAFSIPVNNLPPAYYLLKLSSSDGFSTSKGFIVVR